MVGLDTAGVPAMLFDERDRLASELGVTVRLIR